MKPAKILFQLSGSIAAYKACAAISRLAQAGHEVQTVATANALRFVGAPTLEGLTGRAVLTDAFAAGHAMQHIDAMKWADVVILCPASANTINKLAAGIGDDLVSTLFLAHDFAKPYLVAPAMNTKMYLHPATQASIAKLRGWGVSVLEAASGALACGDVGSGRLLEPDAVVAALEKALGGAAPGPAAGSLRVLITSGGTREPIDSVRAIANFSTGQTGAAIADWFAARGHRVTLLKARDAAIPGARAIAIREFVTVPDLESALRAELGGGRFDAVVHAAAVGDYAIDLIEDEVGSRLPTGAGKADSSGGLKLHLAKRSKLLPQLREFAGGRPLQVVAFKLTSGAALEARKAAVAKLAREAQPDFVVQNDLSEIGGGGAHPALIYDGEGRERASCATKDDLARAIESLLLAGLAAPRGKDATL